MTTKRENIACRPGTTDAMARLAAENEALRAELESVENLAIKQGEWLQAIVNITKGDPGELACHSTHDAVESFEALRVERDDLKWHVARLKDAITYSSHYLDSNPANVIGHRSKAHMELYSALIETPAQSTAHIKAQGAREALQAARYNQGYSDTVVRVDDLLAAIEQMESDE